MTTSSIKSQVQDGIDHIEKGMAAISAIVADGAHALGDERDELQSELRSFGRRLARNSSALGKEASRDLRAHPYAFSGAAIALGTVALAVLWQKTLRH